MEAEAGGVCFEDGGVKEGACRNSAMEVDSPRASRRNQPCQPSASAWGDPLAKRARTVWLHATARIPRFLDRQVDM